MTNSKAKERLEKTKKRQNIFFLVSGAVALTVLLGYFMYMDYSKSEDDQTTTDLSDKVSKDIVEIQVSEVDNGKFHFFSNNIDGVSVGYFVVKDENGDIRTAFNACEVCYAAKKGYAQDGDSARCLNCGREFPVKDLGVDNGQGDGCWPGYLFHSINNGKLTIKLSDLGKGKYLFE